MVLYNHGSIPWRKGAKEQRLKALARWGWLGAQSGWAGCRGAVLVPPFELFRAQGHRGRRLQAAREPRAAGPGRNWPPRAAVCAGIEGLGQLLALQQQGQQQEKLREKRRP